jgi:hypothetical protein
MKKIIVLTFAVSALVSQFVCADGRNNPVNVAVGAPFEAAEFVATAPFGGRPDLSRDGRHTDRRNNPFNVVIGAPLEAAEFVATAPFGGRPDLGMDE